MEELRSLLSTNQRDRLAKEKAAQDRIDDPKLPRHTLYQGDRKIQQLGDGIIENGIVLNNQAIAIGDPVLPLAKGNVLRRVDNTNGGALLGTAYRNAVENDFDANGNRRNLILSRNGGNEPSDPLNPNPVNPNPVNPSTHPIFPPPFGCTPPPSKCFWTTNPMPPDGFQNYGSAVVNENALPLYLHCIIGTSVPKNLNCSFLDPQKWSCSAGVCSLDPNGIYSSKAQCEAALVRKITVSANFWASRFGCVNGSPETYTFTLSPSAVAPFTPVYTYLDGICGGRYTVIVVDSLGNRVDQGVTCFNGVSCSMIGQGAVTISVSSSCP
jgi:hypothetical protein